MYINGANYRGGITTVLELFILVNVDETDFIFYKPIVVYVCAMANCLQTAYGQLEAAAAAAVLAYDTCVHNISCDVYDWSHQNNTAQSEKVPLTGSRQLEQRANCIHTS